MIATPLRSSDVGYCTSLMSISGLYGAWVPSRGQSDIYLAREAIANQFFLDRNFDVLVWIDSDIDFTREQYLELVESSEPLVSGLYTARGMNLPHCKYDDGQLMPLNEIPESGMIKSRWLPGGFLKVHRCVFKAIVDQKLTRTYGPDGILHEFYQRRFFATHPMSEDYAFADLAREAGVQGWLNCGLRVDHDGRKFGC